jgi:DNA-binding beta-propeller fold protein YncE
MVQCVLRVERTIKERATWKRAVLVVLLLVCPAWASHSRKEKPALSPPPDLLLEGGRKLIYERAFSSERDVRKKPGFFGKMLNIIAGEPDMHALVRPYSIAVDSRGRAIITDPGADGIHIFDFAQQKYKFIERRDKGKDSMRSPQCVAVDAQDNIYVTDSDVGKLFVFNADGKYQRVIGSLKGGEGYFKRPTGIAVDSAAKRIYITDTLRDKIFVLDFQGSVMQTIGHHGSGNGEFNFPTELKLADQDLVVVDVMNFRIQLLDRSGAFRTSIGQLGDTSGTMFRPKGVAIDSEGHYYVADGLWGVVQVFDSEGRLLYYFGKRGAAAGDFQLPAGVFIDHGDRVFVVDSYNRRIQVFQYVGLNKQVRKSL